MPSNPIDHFITNENKNRLRRNKIAKIAHLVSSVFLFVAIYASSNNYFDANQLLSISLATASLLIYSIKFWPKNLKPIDPKSLYPYLEIKYSDTPVSPSKLGHQAHDTKAASAWSKKLDIEKEHLKITVKESLRGIYKRLFSSTAILLACLFFFGGSFSKSFNNIISIVNALSKKNTLVIKEGILKESDKKQLILDPGETISISLLPQNLVEIKLSLPFSDSTPSVTLKKAKGDEDTVFQQFQMAPVRDEKSGKVIDKYFQISFSTESSVEVYIDEFSSSTPVASIKIEKLPVPEITLDIAEREFKEPWPDEKPIRLKITSDATNPLRKITLLITSSGKTSEELVANILKNDQKSYRNIYELVLERYIDQDLAEVEIVAEAVDRAVPKPLVGYSDPVRIKTASAYGRYQATLQNLKKIKSGIDESKQNGSFTLSRDLEEHTAKITELSEDTPFFDVIDRMTINSITTKTNDLIDRPNSKQTILLSISLDEFLFEHEMLDDRERDRDFFVAARSLSRILEKPKKDRRIDAEFAIEKVNSYLEQRRKRWKIRVDRISPEFRPKSASKILKGSPFISDLNKILKLEKKGKDVNENSLITLSKLVPKYRSWIEELEKAEDKNREAKQRKMQQSLKQKENQLKELQKQQAIVSKDLDRASSQKKASLKKKWPKTKSLEKKIRQKTLSVAAEMGMMAPEAAERVMAAAEAMSVTITAGDSSNFIRSESGADLAGRLLRQAQSKAQQRRNQQQGGRQRKRRRVSGDNYFGRAVMGGDVAIQRTYEVDKRYRESILNEIRSSDASPEDKKILNKYLRETVR